MIIIMGMAGAGKSSEGRMLADERGYAWISTGAILRVLITGKRRQEMLSGKLLTDEEVIKVVDKTLELVDTREEFVLDGFPRTLDQADWLLRQIENNRLDFTVIIHLKVSEEIVRKRLSSRARQDDSDAAITERLEEYRNQTLPILHHFAGKGLKLVEVDASLSIPEIHHQILAVVDAVHDTKSRG